MNVPSLKPPGAVTGLATLLLAYVIGMAALATLWPLNFRLQPLQVIFASSVEDVVLNLGLLLPAGFLWRLAHPVRRAPKCLDVLVLGVGFSALLEVLQFFLPSRCASPTDVVLNGLGAWTGAGLHAWLKSRYRHAWLDRVCLALPLTKLLYLTVPLIGLQAWTAGPAAVLGLIPLVVFSATIAAELHARITAEAGMDRARDTLWRFAGGFALLFNLAASPLWARMPDQAGVLVILAFAAALVASFLERWLATRERRFELVAVRRALPWFAGYLALAAWQPVGGQLSALGGAARGLLLLRDVAAFSVLGYMLSQLHSRRPLSTWRWRTAGWLLLAVPAFGAIRLWSGTPDAAELALLLGAGGLGAAIHRAELAVVRALRGPASDRPGSAGRSSRPESGFSANLPHST